MIRIIQTAFLCFMPVFLSACAAGGSGAGSESATEAGSPGKKIMPAGLPTVAISPQFRLETDLKAELSPEITRAARPRDNPDRKLAQAILSRLDTYFRTLYLSGFGLSSDRTRRGFTYYKNWNRTTIAARRQIETIRPHPVAQMNVTLFTREDDYRAHVRKSGLLEYYGDAAWDPGSLRLATYLHDTEDATFDAMFRLICHGFIRESLAPDFPPWLEFGLVAYMTRLDRRTGMYLITGKDTGRLTGAQAILRDKSDVSLRSLLTLRLEKSNFSEENRLLAYGFVYWMFQRKSSRDTLYAYIHTLRYNEEKRKALALWNKMPEEKRKKIKRPDPKPETDIQTRFFSRLKGVEITERYWKRWMSDGKFAKE